MNYFSIRKILNGKNSGELGDCLEVFAFPGCCFFVNKFFCLFSNRAETHKEDFSGKSLKREF